MAGEPGHYFDEQPSAPSRRRTVTLAVPGGEVELATDRGVFSAGGIDPGTLVLVQEAPAPPASGTLLDLGCGYGPIAVSLATRAPETAIWALDVNDRALALTAANAAALGLANIRAARPDDVPDDVRFDGIWSNPPVRVGKAILHEMLLRWLGRLTPDGRAWLVVQKHLGSDSLARWLVEQGHPTRRLTSRRSYRVLEVEPRS